MKHRRLVFVGVGLAALALVFLLPMWSPSGEKHPSEHATIRVDYPLQGSVFPPEIVAPTFAWQDAHPLVDAWQIEVRFSGAATAPSLEILVPGDPPTPGVIDPACVSDTNEIYQLTPLQAAAHTWTPEASVWERMKRGSVAAPAHMTISGVDRRHPDTVLSRGQLDFTTSRDPVGAPIFYRDVPLMPSRGQGGLIKPLSANAVPLIAWRLRDIARPDSRLLLKSMPSCANCHSFSLDGKTMGMDVDGPDGDKGAYALVPIAKHLSIQRENVITWNSFKPKPKGHKTIGFLSRIAPDGRFAVTTVNEALYVANFLDHEFLQVFFPTRGILAWHSRESGEMSALPGADDPAFVHCDPVWTPDGKALVFARAEARDPYVPGRPLATYPNDPNETQIQYDLYRMPFDGGQGGQAEPLDGASANGMSNTFPKVSPDGKWVVFVKCRNGQLMRPDSRLWIVPAEGGVAREMRCNTRLMNSWHSFSPNSRWLVFSSKSNTPYTQMFLTHIDEEGRDSPAILIPNSTAANRAVNIPEFLNAPYDALQSIEVPAANHYLDLQRGVALLEQGKFDEAMAFFESALEKDPEFSAAHVNLGMILAERGRLDAAIGHYRRALEVNAARPMAHVNLGFALGLKGQPDLAILEYEKALRIDSSHAMANNNLGFALFEQGRLGDAVEHYRRAVSVDPAFALAWKNLGMAFLKQGQPSKALEAYGRALEAEPEDVVTLASLSRILLRRGEFAPAVAHMRARLKLDPTNVTAQGALAWQLATCPVSSVRSGAEAVALAESACKASGRRRPELLEALAAAYAEVGRFEEAVQTSQAARALLSPDQAVMAQGIGKRIELYRAGTPYRAPAPTAPGN